VLDRIVRKVGYDEEEIARLVVAYETEPPPDRRFASRLFPLIDVPADVAPLGERLNRYVGRYFRVGIARWMAIDEVESDRHRLKFSGTYRYYNADAEREEDEEEEDSYRLLATRRMADATLLLRADARSRTSRRRGQARAARPSWHWLTRQACGVSSGLLYVSTSLGGEMTKWDARLCSCSTFSARASQPRASR